MKKLYLIAGVVFLLSLGMTIKLFPQAEETLEDKFNNLIHENELYGGGVIYSYDTETGEITGKRRQDYSIAPKNGGLSVLDSDVEKIGLENLPLNVVIVDSDKSVMEVMNGS